MSHFSVVVCIEDPAKLDAVMAPYDENLEVEPYRDYEEGQPSGHLAVTALREHQGLNPDDATLTWAQVAEAYNKRYDDEAPMLIDGDRAYTMSTANPEAKWDYWRIGGRWGGYFPYKEGRARQVSPAEARSMTRLPDGPVVLLPEHGWDSPETIGPLHCDGGPKSALDLDGLRNEKETAARKLYAEFADLTQGTPPARPWSEFVKLARDLDSYTMAQAREDYHSQPRMQRLKGTDFQWDDDAPEAFQSPVERYVLQQVARAVPGFATITTDGRWMAPGRMGWFAATDATDDTTAGYLEVANAYIEALPDEVYLIATDCHV